MRRVRLVANVDYDESSDSDPAEWLEESFLRWVSEGGLAPLESDLVVETFNVEVEEVE